MFCGSHLSEPSPRTAHALRRGRVHDHAFLGHAPTRPSLFWSLHTLTRLPPLICALSRAPSPSLSLCASAREACCGPSPFAMVLCSFCGRRRALAVSVSSVSYAPLPATRDTPRFAPFPFVSIDHAHSSSLCIAVAPWSSTRDLAVPRMPFESP